MSKSVSAFANFRVFAQRTRLREPVLPLAKADTDFDIAHRDWFLGFIFPEPRVRRRRIASDGIPSTIVSSNVPNERHGSLLIVASANDRHARRICRVEM